MDAEAILKLVESGYNELTDRFQSPFLEDFLEKPIDRDLLARFVELCRDRPVCDVGCGAGAVAGYLSSQGLEDVTGIDLAPKSVQRARELNPEIRFREMNLLKMDFEKGWFGGLTAFFSIIHLPLEQVPEALDEFSRVLQPDGVLLLSCYAGEGERYLEPGEGFAVRMFSSFHSKPDIVSALERAGFTIIEAVERAAYRYEFDCRRIFVLGRKS